MPTLLVTLSVLFLLLPPAVFGASLYLDPATATLNRGDSLTVALRLDTDEAAGECINAVNAVITYSESIQPVDYSLGNSIFSLWVEPPTIDKERRQITLAGGIPNGYCGRIIGDPRLSNIIAEIIFRSPGLQIGGGAAASQAVIAVSPSSTVYLNDGTGALAPLSVFPSNISLGPSAGPALVDTWREAVANDDIPPREFSITLAVDEKAFNGKYFIVFNTTDKETGISHYEVMEEPLSSLGAFNWGRGDAPWTPARSPYVLTDQSLNSVIRVRAIDKAGNEYVAVYIPEASLRTFSEHQVVVYVLVATLLVLVVVISMIIGRWWRRRKAVRDEPAHSNDL